MKILVTGGAGYLGSVLVGKLLEAGHQITVLDILMFGVEGLIAHMGNPGFSLIKADVRNKSSIKKVFTDNNFDAVVSLAALVGEPACKVNPLLTKQINHLAPCQLAKLAKKNSVKRF